MGINRAVSPETSRRHAVKEIHSVFNAHKKIFRLADAEQVAGLFFRQYFIDPFYRRGHILLRKRATDTEPIKIQTANILHLITAVQKPANLS